MLIAHSEPSEVLEPCVVSLGWTSVISSPVDVEVWLKTTATWTSSPCLVSPSALNAAGGVQTADLLLCLFFPLPHLLHDEKNAVFSPFSWFQFQVFI